MSKASTKTPQNPPPQPPSNVIPDGPRRSSRIRQASSPPASSPPNKAAAPRSSAAPKAAAAATTHPSAEEEDPPSTDSESTALLIIAGAPDKIVNGYQMPDYMKTKLGNLSRYASKQGIKECKKEIVHVSKEDVREIRKDLIADISEKYATLENKISDVVSNQERILKVADSLAKDTEGINATTKGIVDKMAQVNDATVQIASTTMTYKDALLAQPNQPLGTMVDLKLKDDLERKTKQILVVTHGEDLGSQSLTEIRRKANKAIAQLENELDRPEKVEIESVHITRTKAILLQLNTKEAADWLRDPFIESKFTAKFAKDSLFVDREYSIIVPRTPITFDPKNEAHLRETEEINNLSSKSIKKARWIKPVRRRREGQTHAYAILSLTSPSMANQLIRKGITICRAKTIPSKLKHEPMQCLRCRGWGHLVAQCHSTYEICGACGEEHNTNECSNPHKHFCASCKVNTHASWDRGCPEFIRRCESYNNRFPENNLPFFPTVEAWTLTTRPDKIPLENCFP
jgi:hypothetical protein